jgi:hypothetical protein
MRIANLSRFRVRVIPTKQKPPVNNWRGAMVISLRERDFKLIPEFFTGYPFFGCPLGQ